MDNSITRRLNDAIELLEAQLANTTDRETSERLIGEIHQLEYEIGEEHWFQDQCITYGINLQNTKR